MRNKHENTCQRLQPGMEESVGMGGVGGASRGGNNIRSKKKKQNIDLNHAPLEFTSEFH